MHLVQINIENALFSSIIAQLTSTCWHSVKSGYLIQVAPRNCTRQWEIAKLRNYINNLYVQAPYYIVANWVNQNNTKICSVIRGVKSSLALQRRYECKSRWKKNKRRRKRSGSCSFGNVLCVQIKQIDVCTGAKVKCTIARYLLAFAIVRSTKSSLYHRLNKIFGGAKNPPDYTALPKSPAYNNRKLNTPTANNTPGYFSTSAHSFTYCAPSHSIILISIVLWWIRNLHYIKV